MRVLGIIALSGAVLLAGCQKDGSSAGDRKPTDEMPLPAKAQPRLQTTRLYLGTEELTAELALTQEQRTVGMMFRETMAENEAMLFVFPAPHRTAFWMKNTPVPLSAAYIDPSGVILEIHDLHPHNTNSVTAASDQIQYVLETSQGWFQRHNVGVGTLVRSERGALQDTFSFSRVPGGQQ